MAADVLAGIKLISKADTSGIVKMTDAVASFQKEVSAAKTNVTPFLTVGKSFVGVGLAIEASLGLAAAAAVNYQYLIQRIATSSGLAADQIGYLHDRFLQLSTQMATSADDLAKLGFSASKLGLDAAGIEKFARTGAQLNIISGGAITGEEAIGRIGRISKVFGLDLAGNVDKVASTFVGLAKQSTATESEIAAIVGRTAELGRQVGFTVPQLAALAATAKDVGLDGRRASGAIESLLDAMVKKDSARFFARQLHMTGYEFQQALGKNPVAILNRLQGAFHGLDPRILDDRLKRLGITENSTKTLVLGLADAHSSLAKNIKIANEEYEKGTAATKAYEELIDTTKMQLQLLWNSIKAVAISFGEVLLPPLKLVLKAMTFMLQIVLAIPKPIKVIIVAIAALIGVLSLLVGASSIAITTAIALKVAVAKAAVAIYGEGAAAFSTSLQLLAFGQSMMIAASEAAFGAASFFEAAFGAGSLGETISLLTAQLFVGEIGWTAFSAGVYEAAAAVVTLEMLTGIGEIILIVAAAVGLAVLAWYALKSVVMDVVDAFKSLWAPVQIVIDGVNELASSFGITGGGIGDTLITFMRISLFPIISHLKALAFVLRFVSAFLTGVARSFIALTKPVVEPFVKLLNIVRSVIQPIFDLFDSFVVGGTNAQGFFDIVAEGAAFAFKWLSPIGSLLNEIGTVFRVLEFIVSSVWDGIVEAFQPVYEQLYGSALLISEAWDDVVAAFDDLLFPFRIFLSELGILEGAGDGVFKVIGRAIKWVVSTALTPMVYVLRFLIGLVTGLARIWLFAGEIILKAITFVARPLKYIADLISGIVTGLAYLIRGTEDAAPAAASAVTQAGDAIEASQDAIGMERVTRSIPALRKPRIIHEDKLKKFSLEPVERAERARVALRAHEDDGARGEPTPVFRAPLTRLTSAVRAQTAATTRTAQGSSGQLPAMNITIPVSVMLDGEEIGQAVVSVNDEQIRRQFGSRQRRFSGVE